MPKKRLLHPQSVWDADALAGAFDEAGVKPLHIFPMYK